MQRDFYILQFRNLESESLFVIIIPHDFSSRYNEAIFIYIANLAFCGYKSSL